MTRGEYLFPNRLNRRELLALGAAAAAGAAASELSAAEEPPPARIGSGQWTYEWDPQWGVLPEGMKYVAITPTINPTPAPASVHQTTRRRLRNRSGSGGASRTVAFPLFIVTVLPVSRTHDPFGGVAGVPTGFAVISSRIFSSSFFVAFTPSTSSMPRPSNSTPMLPRKPASRTMVSMRR